MMNGSHFYSCFTVLPQKILIQLAFLLFKLYSVPSYNSNSYDCYTMASISNHRVGSVVSMLASRVVGHGFNNRPGHTKDHHKNCCVKGRVVCGTVYGDMHYKDLLGSIEKSRVLYPVPDFYLVLHVLRCRKSTMIDKTNKQPFLFML